MFDIQTIRDNPSAVAQALLKKRHQADLASILALDEKRRKCQGEIDELRARQNAANDEIATLKRANKDAGAILGEMKRLSQRLGDLEPQAKRLKEELGGHLIGIPNLPHDSVPVGGPEKNVVVRAWGKPAAFDFKPKTHIELAEALDIVDFKRGAKITGANFIVFKGLGARLERALINFMLDLHTREHGYSELMPPVVVNRESMTGTGQLPKMEEDMYKLKDDDLFLIPTAEVPVTNLYRDEVLEEERLPIYHAAFSSCFRREAGSYGKDTKGMVRVHQFEKVELVKFVKPQGSYEELESLVANAEAVFQRLEIPYRVIMLSSGELSFAAAKCYDIEVHAGGANAWLEASSCSNFEGFQARRANIRYKAKAGKKPEFVHTLNGSGVALPRTMIALMENYQNKEGEIDVPACLVPYMGGIKKITKPKV
jgi:seryl-tRNA synthetase